MLNLHSKHVAVFEWAPPRSPRGSPNRTNWLRDTHQRSIDPIDISNYCSSLAQDNVENHRDQRPVPAVEVDEEKPVIHRNEIRARQPIVPEGFEGSGGDKEAAASCRWQWCSVGGREVVLDVCGWSGLWLIDPPYKLGGLSSENCVWSLRLFANFLRKCFRRMSCGLLLYFENGILDFF